MENKFDAIVVLCAEEVGIEGENRERIIKGLSLVRHSKTAYFIFLGTRMHNQNLKKYLKNKKIGVKALYPIIRKHATTRTQLVDFAHFLKKKSLNKLLFVSHAYHIPRIKLYCKKYLPKNVKYKFFSVGKIKNQQKQVEKEIRKIIKYQSKGHL